MLLALAGLLPRLHLWHRLDQQAQVEKTKAPAVTTARPERAPAVVDVPLPGTTEPLLTTGIYARTDGYLKARYVDIGDHVKAGQLLADITAPEVDQQLSQTLGDARAGQGERGAAPGRPRARPDDAPKRFIAIGVGAVTQQEIDDRTAAAEDGRRRQSTPPRPPSAPTRRTSTGCESCRGSSASTRRSTAIITVRNVDPGSLISAGSTSVTTQLF